MLLLRDVGSMATSFCCSVSGLSCPVTGAHHGARRPGVMATAISLGKPEQVSQTDRNNHFPWPAYNNSLLQPRISLVFIAARPHCCSTFTLPCTYNSKRMAGNVACTPCHCTEHYPGEWRASLVAALHPRKNWARHRTHFQNNLEDTWSKENGIE